MFRNISNRDSTQKSNPRFSSQGNNHSREFSSRKDRSKDLRLSSPNNSLRYSNPSNSTGFSSPSNNHNTLSLKKNLKEEGRKNRIENSMTKSSVWLRRFWGTLLPAIEHSGIFPRDESKRSTK
jgi:hypothetical protein